MYGCRVEGTGQPRQRVIHKVADNITVWGKEEGMTTDHTHMWEVEFRLREDE